MRSRAVVTHQIRCQQSSTWLRLTLVLQVVLLVSLCILKTAQAAAEEQGECASANGASEEETCTAPSSVDHDEDQCTLYMAESAIPNAGWGMYTATDRPFHNPIPYPDVSISLEAFRTNQRLRQWHDKQKYSMEVNPDEPVWLLEAYSWDSHKTWAVHDAASVRSFVPGLGMLANSHPGLVNADMVEPPVRTTTDWHRSKHPGAGAVSDYHIAFQTVDTTPVKEDQDAEDVVEKVIPAGHELFVDYGMVWFDRHEAKVGQVPLAPHYAMADSTLEAFQAEFGDNLSGTFATALWEKLQETDDPRLKNAYPKTVQEIPKVLAAGGTAAYSIPHQHHIRSLEWLQQHGSCLDNLKPAKSTMEGAGQGAFAVRPLQEGQVIAPVPVVHLFRKHLGIYQSDNTKDPESPVQKESDQLMLNYCYGHPNSSVLLFPYSPMVNYMNHADSPNAVLRWSQTHAAQHHNEWLQLSPTELEGLETPKAGLVLELVALRDIAVDEEVVLDYGPDWVAAWEAHVQAFSPTDDDKAYLSATELTALDPVPLKTMSEAMRDPYPSQSFQTVCMLGAVQKRLEHLEMASSSMKVFQWEPPTKMPLWSTLEESFKCIIIRRQQLPDSNPEWGTSYTYTVQVDLPGMGMTLVTEMPRQAIRFFDYGYSTDMYQRTAFRHAISLPQDLVPDAWKDLE